MFFISSLDTVFGVKKTDKKGRLEIESIEKVFNDSLKQKFEHKKREYIERYGHTKVVNVFHGTKRANISSILKSNLDVSRHGQNIGMFVIRDLDHRFYTSKHQ